MKASGVGLLAAIEPAGAASLPDIGQETTLSDPVDLPTEWLQVGAFHDSGEERDYATEFLQGVGGIDGVSDDPDSAEGSLTSWIGGAGTVEWESVEASTDADGSISLSSNFWGNTFAADGARGHPGYQDYRGWASNDWRGYALTTVEVDDGPKTGMLEESGVETVWINGRQFQPVGGRTPVVLDEGTNVLLIKTGIDSIENLRIAPPEASVEIAGPIPDTGNVANLETLFYPTLVEGEQIDQWASITVMNTTAQRVDDATLSIGGAEIIEDASVDVDPLGPLESRRVQIPFRTTEELSSEQVDSLASSFTITVEAGESTHTREAPVTTQDPTKTLPRIVYTRKTDYDGSVQMYGFQPPNPDAEPGPDGHPLLITLHGSGAKVTFSGAYGPNVWDGYVVGAHNRGTDFQDHGTPEVLDLVDHMVENHDIDENRIYLTGHSMGGHGAWHNGLTYADRFAAIAPSAGWTDLPSYGMTDTLGRHNHWAHPDVRSAYEKALYPEKAFPLTENATNLPIFILHGGYDGTVDPEHPRSYLDALANQGISVNADLSRRKSSYEAQVEYLEVPDEGHWFNFNLAEDNGADTLAHPDMMEFVRNQERDPYPTEVQFHTTNLRKKSTHYWVTVTEQEEVHAPTRVHAAVDGGLTISTENVTGLTVDLEVLSANDASANAIEIDGDRVPITGRARRDGEATLSRPGNSWTPSDSGGSTTGRKGPEQYGPMNEAYYSSFRLVYGTQGDAAETDYNWAAAKTHADWWTHTADGTTHLLPDEAVTEETLSEHNVVLFGRPESNSVLADLHGDLPVDVRGGSIEFPGQATYDESDLAVRFVYPNPDYPENLVAVNAGTTARGTHLATATEEYIGLPDFAVYGDEVHWQSVGAFRAAGFFDKNWEIDATLGHFR